jgi:protein SCO1/2
MRRALGGFLVATAALLTPAFALSPAELAGVGVSPPAGAALPLGAELTDLAGRATTLGAAIGGRAAIVVFADYRCPQLCSPILAVAGKALADSGLTPGADFRLVVLGFNPRADAADARRMVDGQIGLATPVGRVTAALLAAPDVAGRLAAAVGYHYVYDKAQGRYAHPAALLAVSPDGRLSRILSGLAADGQDMRLALVEAGQGRVGSLVDQLHLLCYGFDAQTGVYTSRIHTLLSVAGGLTIAAVGGALLALSRRSARGRRA